DDRDFTTRREAARQLAELGERVEGALRAALEKPASAEAQRQLQALLRRLEGPVTEPEPRRAPRAVGALERGGTAEARRVLEGLAGGAPEARLTREARASLRRLEKRSPE